MDKIWDRKSFGVVMSLAVVAGMKKRMTTQNRQKSNTNKNIKKMKRKRKKKRMESYTP